MLITIFVILVTAQVLKAQDDVWIRPNLNRNGQCQIFTDRFSQLLKLNDWVSCERAWRPILDQEWTQTLMCRCVLRGGKPTLQTTNQPVFDGNRCLLPVKRSGQFYIMRPNEWTNYCPDEVREYIPGSTSDAPLECRCVVSGQDEVRLEKRRPQPFIDDRGFCFLQTIRGRSQYVSKDWRRCDREIQAFYPQERENDQCRCKTDGGKTEIIFRKDLEFFENGQCQFYDNNGQIQRFPVYEWFKPCPRVIVDQFRRQTWSNSLYCHCTRGRFADGRMRYYWHFATVTEFRRLSRSG